jgi:hypothetical protein
MVREGRGGRKRVQHVGLAGVGWYEVGDIGDDGCEKTGVVLKNLDDHTLYFVFGYANGVRRVRLV